MSTTALTQIEVLRASLHAHIDAACDAVCVQLSSGDPPQGVTFKSPSLTDGHDPRNKNGLNLTPRGVEILYRVFDEEGGYNRAAKMLNISQGARRVGTSLAG